jgi:hypothetical protein
MPGIALEETVLLVTGVVISLGRLHKDVVYFFASEGYNG